jgi:hypothetical protein
MLHFRTCPVNLRRPAFSEMGVNPPSGEVKIRQSRIFKKALKLKT